MIKEYFTIAKRVLLFLAKCAALVFVAGMVLVQIPELRYDFSNTMPVKIENADDLFNSGIDRSTFVSIAGKANFDQAFVYQRYGMNYTYFTLKPYDIRLIVRTYETVTDEWNDIERFLGKIRPFEKQPFSYRIRSIVNEKFKLDIPENSFFLGLRDVPDPSGWQVGAIIFACVLWIVMFYMFFFFDWKTSSTVESVK